MTAPRVLFVCTGNLYRSPLAERLLAARLPAARVGSAGTHAFPRPGMAPETRHVLEERGGDGAGFASQALTPGLVAGADLVLGMERAHREAVVRLGPGALHRAFTLREFLRLAVGTAPDAPPATVIAEAAAHRGLAPPVPVAEDEVEDPYGAGEDVLRDCARTLDGLVARLAASLGGPG